MPGYEEKEWKEYTESIKQDGAELKQAMQGLQEEVQQWKEIALAEVSKSELATQRADRLQAEVAKYKSFAEDQDNLLQQQDRLQAEVERLKNKLAEQKTFTQGYYDQAQEGWMKFRKAEKQLTSQRTAIQALADALKNELCCLDCDHNGPHTENCHIHSAALSAAAPFLEDK